MKTQCSICTLAFLVALVAGCGGSLPSEQSQGGGPGSSDDRGSIGADPTGAVSMTGSSAANSPVSNGDAGAPSEIWARFRLPFSPPLAATLLVVADADGGGE
jgi:hypothetical protein